MSLQERFGNIANAAWQGTESGFEFFTDLVQEFDGSADDYDGIVGTIWGSWNDNILGEGGVLQSAIGPEGVGGEIIDSMPGFVKETGRPIFNATFDTIDALYEMGIDRPVAVLFTLANAGLMDGTITNYLDPRVWQQANDILDAADWGDFFSSKFYGEDKEGGERSAGQAFALMVNQANILDPTEVERIEGTALYKLSSGIVDAAMQWWLDPTNIAGKAVRIKNIQKTEHLKQQVASGNYEAVLETTGYQRFKQTLKSIADSHEGLSIRFTNGNGFKAADETKIGELATSVWRAARAGKFGRPFRQMTWDEAQTYAALSGGLDIGRTDQAFDYMIRIQLGDTQAIADMEKAARVWVNETLNTNVYDELMSVNDQLDWLDEMERANWTEEANQTLPPQLQRMIRRSELTPKEIFETRKLTIDRLLKRQRTLEQSLFGDGYGHMPFAAALILKQERLHTLAKNLSQAINPTTAHKGLNWFNDAINDNPALVTAAADEILMNHNVNLLEPIPMINSAADTGIRVKTYIQNSPFGKGFLANSAVRLIVEKTPHQLMNWDDPAQQFTNFERMLRDAGNVVYDGRTLLDEAGLTADGVLGEFMQISSQKGRREFFDNQVKKLNESLPELFGKHLNKNDLEKMSTTLQRQYGSAQEILQTHARATKAYGNTDYSRLDYASDGETMARHIPMTPAQLRESSLVPRYDLYQQAFGDTMSSTSKKVRANVEHIMTGFTSIWKKAVLLRPAWPMRVLIDEVARNAATMGASATLSGVMAGFHDLRVAWFRKQGIDLGRPMMKEILEELDLAKKRARIPNPSFDEASKLDPGSILNDRWDDWLETTWELTPDDYGELLHAYNQAEKLGIVPRTMQELVTDVIGKQYGIQRTRKRTALTTGLGLFLAGPVGAGIGGLYSLYGRNTMRRVARSEIVTNQKFMLQQAARGDLSRELTRIRDQISKLDPDDLASAKALTKEAENLQTASRILERGAEVIEEHDKWLLDNLKTKNLELYDKFDQVGMLAAEGNYNNVYFGGYSVENAFGNSPAAIAIHKNNISSDSSSRQMWEGASAASRRATRQRDRQQYDINNAKHTEVFSQAYNDTVNRQWLPKGDRNSSFGEGQTFMRMIWDGSSDDEILRFLQNEGSVVREAYADQWNRNPRDLIATLREEVQGIVPDLPAFEDVRRNIVDGNEVDWERDIMSVVDRVYGGDIDAVRAAAGTNDFGKIVADSTIQDMADTRNLQMHIVDRINDAFENIGTLPTDALTRSPLFKTIYEREVARQLGSLKGPDGDIFTLTGNDINIIQNRARSKAVTESKDLLYDLAERSRFEEVVANYMPFVGAWQEVITRWTGIAIDNPDLVARVVRNWRILEAEDESGSALSVIRMPNIFKMKIPLAGKLIPFADGKMLGKASILADTALDFRITSVSMIGGTPGIGPLVSFPISEIVIENPSLQNSVDWILPYGINEGTSVLARWFDATSPAWGKAMAGGLGLDTPERSRTLVRITADLAYEYEANGDVIENEADWKVFEDEVYRRTTKILEIRAFGAMSLPMSFRAQSPHWRMINEYYEIAKETGVEAADTWLLHNHADLWVITGRQTAVRGVAGGTLESEASYQKHQEYADNNPLLRDLIIGRVGPQDIKFEHSRAVAIREEQQGRRADNTPKGIYSAASTTKGWREWNQVENFIAEQLEAAALMGQSADIQAHPKLLDLRRSAAVVMGQTNRAWYEEYMEPQNPLNQAKIIQGLRDLLLDPTFNYRPDWPLIERWVDNHDNTAFIMWERYMDSGDRNYLRLGFEKNADIAADFHNANLELRLRPDFVDLYSRYLSNIDTVTQSNFAWNYPTVTRSEAA